MSSGTVASGDHRLRGPPTGVRNVADDTQDWSFWVVITASGCRAPAKSRSAPNARTCLSLESDSRPGPTPSRGAGPRRGLIGQMGDESGRCRGPGSDPACAAQTGHCRLPASTQLNDAIPERWIQAESPTEEGRGYPWRYDARPGMAKGRAIGPGPGHGTRSDEAIRLRGELLER